MHYYRPRTRPLQRMGRTTMSSKHGSRRRDRARLRLTNGELDDLKHSMKVVADARDALPPRVRRKRDRVLGQRLLRCPRCKREKPWSSFWISHDGRNSAAGYRAKQCGECRAMTRSRRSTMKRRPEKRRPERVRARRRLGCACMGAGDEPPRNPKTGRPEPRRAAD